MSIKPVPRDLLPIDFLVKAQDAYFEARSPMLDTRDRRSVFEAGFGYGCGAYAQVSPDSALSNVSVNQAFNDPRLQQLFADTIEAAIASGAQGTGRPPEGHWLFRFWEMGRADAPRVTSAASPALDLSMKRGEWGSLAPEAQDKLRAVTREAIRDLSTDLSAIGQVSRSMGLDSAQDASQKASVPAAMPDANSEVDQIQKLAKVAYDAGMACLVPGLRGKPWELAGVTNMLVWTSAIEAVLQLATSVVVITDEELDEIRVNNICMKALECDEIQAMRDAMALYIARSTTLAPYSDAARYRKLRGWMSSNVPEGWEEVCRMASVACWVDWAQFDAYLDGLPHCNVGLMQTTPSATPNQDSSC